MSGLAGREQPDVLGRRIRIEGPCDEPSRFDRADAGTRDLEQVCSKFGKWLVQ